MTDNTQVGDLADDNSDSTGRVVPEMEVDFGIGRLYIKGDSETSFEEVVEEFNEQKEDMKGTIEILKRMEYELRDEFTEEDVRSANGSAFG